MASVMWLLLSSPPKFPRMIPSCVSNVTLIADGTRLSGLADDESATRVLSSSSSSGSIPARSSLRKEPPATAIN